MAFEQKSEWDAEVSLVKVCEKRESSSLEQRSELGALVQRHTNQQEGLS